MSSIENRTLSARLRGAFQSLVFAFVAFTASLAAANDTSGLQRFEAILPALQGELKTGGAELRVGSMTQIGVNGFALNDFVLTWPASKSGSPPDSVNIKRLVVESFDFDRLDLKSPDNNQTFPYFAKVLAQGVTSKNEMQDQAAAMGAPDFSYDIALDYRYDPAEQLLTVNRLGVEIPGVSSLSFSMNVEGLSPQAGTKMPNDESLALRNAKLVWDDRSLLKLVVPIALAVTGVSEKDAIGGMALVLGGVVQGRGTDFVAYADALLSYAQDWNAPKGPLSLVLAPAKPLTKDDFTKLLADGADLKGLGLQVVYDGARPGVFGLEMAKAVTGTPAPQPSTRSATAGSVPSAPSAKLAPKAMAKPVEKDTPVRDAKASPKIVKGSNVIKAVYATGRFDYVGVEDGQRMWVETWEDGTKYELEEISFDEWSVYLHDDDRDADIQIDLRKNIMIYDDGSKKKTKPYPLTAVSASAR